MLGTDAAFLLNRKESEAEKLDRTAEKQISASKKSF